MKKFIFIISVIPFTIFPAFVCIKNESENYVHINKPELDILSKYITAKKVTTQGKLEYNLGSMPILEPGAQLLLEIKDSIVADLEIPVDKSLQITPILNTSLNILVMPGRHPSFQPTERLPEEGELIFEFQLKLKAKEEFRLIPIRKYFYRAWFTILPDNSVQKDWWDTLV